VTEYTEERIRRNNEVFRETNERIHADVGKRDHELQQLPFLCECPVEDCVEVIPLTEEQYAAVRANPSHYVTIAGHEESEKPVGRVVARNDGYVIVEKA
jgi:hypothetical protein